MIRAAIVPYFSGAAGIVIADDSATPPRCLLARSALVG